MPRQPSDGHDLLDRDAGPLFANVKGRRDGETFESRKDLVRLNAQATRVLRLMMDGVWRSLGVISKETGDPEASVSARLRDFRKERFGAHRVERKRASPNGLWLYRLVLNDEVQLVFKEAQDAPREETDA